jgi:hypothetical protein
MGYYIRVTDSKFFIPKEQQEAAFVAIKNLVGRETIKDASGYHFSYVKTQDFLKAENLHDALKAWRWKVYFNPNGDIDSIAFHGEKWGDERILFETLAPFIENDSFIEFYGQDDGKSWRFVFEDGKLRKKYPEVIWK